MEVASEKQASDIVLLDTREVCSFADYFVICSADSDRQIKAIQDGVDEVLDKEAVRFRHYEGTADSGWVLLDLGAVIVHIFAPLEREYYQLDKLWNKAKLVVMVQ